MQKYIHIKKVATVLYYGYIFYGDIQSIYARGKLVYDIGSFGYKYCYSPIKNYLARKKKENIELIDKDGCDSESESDSDFVIEDEIKF